MFVIVKPVELKESNSAVSILIHICEYTYNIKFLLKIVCGSHFFLSRNHWVNLEMLYIDNTFWAK